MSDRRRNEFLLGTLRYHGEEADVLTDFPPGGRETVRFVDRFSDWSEVVLPNVPKGTVLATVADFQSLDTSARGIQIH